MIFKFNKTFSFYVVRKYKFNSKYNPIEKKQSKNKNAYLNCLEKISTNVFYKLLQLSLIHDTTIRLFSNI